MDLLKMSLRLAPWLEDNKECPMCKTEITLADDDEGKARGRTER